MLNHLFATILICLGVANTTPISNYDQKKSNLVLTTPKKQNIVQNYTLTLSPTNEVSNTTQIELNNGYIQRTGSMNNSKYNLQGNNSAINIIGNKYNQIVNGGGQWYANYLLDRNSSISQTYYKNVWEYNRYGIMLQITPYNINVETTVNMTLQFEITGQQPDYEIFGVYLKKDFYRATETNWSQFIDMQLTAKMPTNIQNEIENINNGFYYTKEIEYITISENANYTNKQIQVNQSLLITPDVNNYYYIMLTPMLDAGTSTTYTAINMPATSTNSVNNALIITGTNIIPDGTYEVVDIPGIMYEVIGMPFAFVSQAFNLTLFPGTPYQINIANLFLSIAAIFVFVWLLLLFIKMKG